MSDKNLLNEDLQLLNELINKAYQLISPLSFDYEIKWMLDKFNRDKLLNINPKCFLMIKHMGREIPFLPICNSRALIDKNIIDLSLKFANRLVGKDEIDQIHLTKIIFRLNLLKNKYSKEIPKPSDMAGRKAHITRLLRGINRQYKNGE